MTLHDILTIAGQGIGLFLQACWSTLTGIAGEIYQALPFFHDFRDLIYPFILLGAVSGIITGIIIYKRRKH